MKKLESVCSIRVQFEKLQDVGQYKEIWMVCSNAG